MSTDTIALLQLVAAFVMMAANVVLALLTYRYVRLTAGMLEHMRGGQAASVVIDLTFDGHSGYLNVENVGSSAATDIVFEELSGFNWSEHSVISDLRQRGISYLPARRTMRFWLGFPDWDKAREGGEPIRVALRFDTEGVSRRRDFLIDMGQYAGATGESAPEDRIVDAIERLRDAQRDRSGGVFSLFQEVKKSCVMCAEQIPEAAKICSHCSSRQPTDAPAREAEFVDREKWTDNPPLTLGDSVDTVRPKFETGESPTLEHDGVAEAGELSGSNDLYDRDGG